MHSRNIKRNIINIQKNINTKVLIFNPKGFSISCENSFKNNKRGTISVDIKIKQYTIGIRICMPIVYIISLLVL